MKITTVSLLRFAIRKSLLREAKKKKKEKPTKVVDRPHKDNPFRVSGTDPLVRPSGSEIERPETSEEPEIVRGLRPEDFEGEVDVRPVEAPEGFDFDAAFDAARAMGAAARRRGSETDVSSPRLPSGALTTRREAPLAPPGGRRVPAHVDASTLLMDEFVAPAMAVGARLLPTVWTEIQGIAYEHPRVFREQFSAALESVREIENAWFAGLFRFEVQERAPMLPSTGEAREVYDRLMHVLRRYYDSVLRAVQRNSMNLLVGAENIRDRIGDEGFEEAFRAALKDTRDIEDRAFSQFIGRLRLR